NGRFAAVGNNIARGGNVRTVNLMGKTVIPGIIDAHNHIVIVGNRPGWHTPLEHVFTIPDAIAALKARTAEVRQGEFITTGGRALRRRREREYLHDAQPIPRTPPRGKVAGPPADRLFAPGFTYR